jgi:hypothetical protein
MYKAMSALLVACCTIILKRPFHLCSNLRNSPSHLHAVPLTHFSICHRWPLLICPLPLNRQHSLVCTYGFHLQVVSIQVDLLLQFNRTYGLHLRFVFTYSLYAFTVCLHLQSVCTHSLFALTAFPRVQWAPYMSHGTMKTD